MDKFSCERERQRLAALGLHDDGVKSDFHHEMIEEESRAFQQPIDKTIEAPVCVIDRSFLIVEKTLGNDLFTGKYRNDDVSIKYLKTLDVSKVREIARLSHKNVIKISGIYSDPLNHLIIFEPVSRSLHEILHKDLRVLDHSTLIHIALDIACGMKFLHAHQIMHGDITSSDLLMNKDGVIKVSGYGVTGNQKLYTLTMKADVFSYGIVLWELITTETPMSFALEHAKKNFKAKEEDRKPNDFVKQPRNIMETFLDLFRGRIPKEANQMLVGIMEMCWTEEPPSFAEITKLLMEDSVFRGRQSTDTSERYKKPPGFFHYR